MYKFFVHRRHPAYRLVISADAPFPSGAFEDDRRHTRGRGASDVNAEVRGAVERDRYSLFVQNRTFALRNSGGPLSG